MQPRTTHGDLDLTRGSGYHTRGYPKPISAWPILWSSSTTDTILRSQTETPVAGTSQ
jgi:hypothetical protein